MLLWYTILLLSSRNHTSRLAPLQSGATPRVLVILPWAVIPAHERTTSCTIHPLPSESLPCSIYIMIHKKHNKRMLLSVRKTRNSHRGALLQLEAARGRKLKIKGKSEIERRNLKVGTSGGRRRG